MEEEAALSFLASGSSSSSGLRHMASVFVDLDGDDISIPVLRRPALSDAVNAMRTFAFQLDLNVQKVPQLEFVGAIHLLIQNANLLLLQYDPETSYRVALSTAPSTQNAPPVEETPITQPTSQPAPTHNSDVNNDTVMQEAGQGRAQRPQRSDRREDDKNKHDQVKTLLSGPLAGTTSSDSRGRAAKSTEKATKKRSRARSAVPPNARLCQYTTDGRTSYGPDNTLTPSPRAPTPPPPSASAQQQNNGNHVGPAAPTTPVPRNRAGVFGQRKDPKELRLEKEQSASGKRKRDAEEDATADQPLSKRERQPPATPQEGASQPGPQADIMASRNSQMSLTNVFDNALLEQAIDIGHTGDVLPTGIESAYPSHVDGMLAPGQMAPDYIPVNSMGAPSTPQKAKATAGAALLATPASITRALQTAVLPSLYGVCHASAAPFDHRASNHPLPLTENAPETIEQDTEGEDDEADASETEDIEQGVQTLTMVAPPGMTVGCLSIYQSTVPVDYITVLNKTLESAAAGGTLGIPWANQPVNQVSFYSQDITHLATQRSAAFMQQVVSANLHGNNAVVIISKAISAFCHYFAKHLLLATLNSTVITSKGESMKLMEAIGDREGQIGRNRPGDYLKPLGQMQQGVFGDAAKCKQWDTTWIGDSRAAKAAVRLYEHFGGLAWPLLADETVMGKFRTGNFSGDQAKRAFDAWSSRFPELQTVLSTLWRVIVHCIDDETSEEWSLLQAYGVNLSRAGLYTILEGLQPLCFSLHREIPKEKVKDVPNHFAGEINKLAHLPARVVSWRQSLRAAERPVQTDAVYASLVPGATPGTTAESNV